MSNLQEYPLTPQMRLYALARAEGKTKLASAESAGIAEKTVYDWQNDPVKGPAINAEIDRLLDEHTADVRREFKAAARRARERIVQCMEPGYNLGNAADTNLRAAALVLKFAELEPASKNEHSGANGAPLIVERVVFGKGV